MRMAIPSGKELHVTIYVWSDGNWCYDWETTGFLIQHKATLEGGRWIDLDKLYGIYPILSENEKKAIVEALGGE